MNNNFRYPYTSMNDILHKKDAYRLILERNDQFRVVMDIDKLNIKPTNCVEQVMIGQA